MPDLTNDQINVVTNWMNTWEQLKDTAIPLRFQEDFSKQIPHLSNPPIGIIPNWLWQEQRKSELLSAIVRYANENLKIPSEWTAEFKELCDK